MFFFFIAVFSKNISVKNAVLRIFMAQQVFENVGTVKIANEIYMLCELLSVKIKKKIEID